MNEERINELGAAFASGEITREEREELRRGLASQDAGVNQLAGLVDAAALLAPRAAQGPSPALRDRLMQRIQAAAPPIPTLHFLKNAAEKDWIPLRTPGAYAKLLSSNEGGGYAVVLGKLDRGASYPPHVHKGPEDVFVVSGDLTIGQTALAAGDFHHADKGSRHDVNYSKEGCIVLVVLSLEDLSAQF